MKRLLLCVLSATAILCTPLAWAGQRCEEEAPSVEEMRNSFRLALKVRDALEQSGAQAVILARVGQDLSKYGLRYSHAGIILRDHPQGSWLAIHELNECGTATSTLYNQGLANFFADNLFAWDALILIPSEDVQRRLVENLAAGSGTAFHQRRYNMLAYPFSPQYQNSNQWLLEVLSEALAMQHFAGRGEAQQWLKSQGYAPTTLNLPIMTRLGGRIFKANIAFDDHPTDRRVAGQIDVVTVESIASFLSRRDPASSRLVVRLQ